MPEEDLVKLGVLLAGTDATCKERDHKTIPEDRARNKKDLNNVLAKLIKEADIAKILKLERGIILSESRINYTSAQASSSEAALEDIDAALNTVDTLRNRPDEYRIMSKMMTREQNLIGGLPRDEARQCCRAHKTRLQNYAKRSGESREDQETITLRIAAIVAGENSYAKEQRHVLGIPGRVAPKRKSRGMGR